MHTRHPLQYVKSVAGPLAVLALATGACNGETNGRPTAHAGEDQDVPVNASVTLDGTASSDPDGDPLSFSWHLEEKPPASGATLTAEDTQTPGLEADAAGTYLVRLTVSDGALEASDSVSIAAREVDNEAPILASIEDQRTPMGEAIEVPFHVSDEEPAAVAVEASSSDPTLVAQDGLEVLGAGEVRSLRIAPAPMGLGRVTISLVARDADGLESNAAFALEVARPFARQLRKLTANDAAAGDLFGASVAISGDYVVVGAPHADHADTNSGAAYVFLRSGDTWQQSAKLPPEPPEVAPSAHALSAGARFGASVAIDGEYLIVGAPRDVSEAGAAGAAYVYARCVPTTETCTQPWSEAERLTASDAAENAAFGASVAISREVAVVGAPSADEDAPDSGAAYAFQRDGDTWEESGKLTHDGADGDRFGSSVTTDGSVAVIGATRDSDDGSEAGSAFAFRRSDGTWDEAVRLPASDASADDLLGWSVATDGAHAFVSAHRDDADGDSSGAAYVFERSGDAWHEAAKLTAGDAAAMAVFGRSLAVSGNHALIGAPGGAEAGAESGAAYVFQRSRGAWHEANKLLASEPAAGQVFGWSVAIDDSYAVIGARGDAHAGPNAGAAYVLAK